MSTTRPSRLQDLPIPNDPPPISFPDFNFPKLPPSFCDRNRRFHPYPANGVPSDLFTVAQNRCTVPGYRFIRKNDQQQMLMFCDGACIMTGKQEEGEVQPRGGCGVVLTSTEIGKGITSTLENNGILHTTNRAKLRSVLVGLGLRFWPGEGFESVVVATDSEYVVEGVAEKINKWIQQGWKTAEGTKVEDQDLWKALLKRMRELEKSACHVQFWLIPKEWNEAEECATKAALENDPDNDRTTDGGLIPVHLMEV